MKREENIETLRGIAIILMVLGHVVGGDSTKGLRVDNNSFYYYIFYVFEYIRMPLFTVISGYVYAIKPLSNGYPFSKYLLRKVQRLLIPSLIASLLFFLVQISTPGTNSSFSMTDLPSIFYKSYVHFWFAQGIFFVFLLIALLEYCQFLTKIKNWGITITIVFIIFLSGEFGSNLLSSSRWPFLMLFFLFGLGIKRFEINRAQNWSLLFINVSIFVFVTSFVIQQSFFFLNSLDVITPWIDKLFTVTIGLSGSILLINSTIVNRWMKKMGNYSYEIYLYHVFGTAGSRIILHKLGCDNTLLNLISGLLIGLAFPVLFKNILVKSPFLNSIIFGDRKVKGV